MNSYYTTARMMLVGLLVSVGSAWAQSTSRPAAATTAPAEFEGGIGTVKGNSVYVRSGFSKNYYPVLKLNEGDKVTILRGKFGWLEIESPPGAYSLIEKSRIDKTADGAGVANDTAQVYAGSDLDKESKYARQVKLAKGDKVKILGETDKGDFYKVTPPEGATLWISSDFVNRGSKGNAIEVVKKGELDKTLPNDQAPAVSGEKPVKKAGVAAGAAPTHATGMTQANRDLMRVIEAKIAAESLKPPGDQVIEPIIGEMRPLAEQSGDFVAQTWAKTRMEQLKTQTELAAALVEMKQLKEKAITDAGEIARRRAEMKAKMDQWMVNPIQARGEIRASGLYTGGGSQAKRWRLVDPKANRTIAYIELSPNSTLDPVQFYGKYVGIEAVSYQLQHGTVPPLPVYMVKDIKTMDANAPFEPIVRREAIASGLPSTQPSGGEKPATSQPALRSSAQPEPAAVPAELNK